MSDAEHGDAIRFYDRSAAAIAPRYDAVSFEDVHPGLVAQLPAPPARIADVGAGSGRDASALVRLGHHVTAVEPAGALRAHGAAAAPGALWLDDRLPDLARLRERGQAFDFMLCSAVLMSLPADQLAASLSAMARLLAPEGRLAISLRDPRPHETLLTRHDDQAVRAAAGQAGLRLVDQSEAHDALGRDFRWRAYLFERVASAQPGGSDGDRNSS